MSNVLLTNPEVAIQAIATGIARKVGPEMALNECTKDESFEAGVALGMVWLWRRIEKSCSDSSALLVAMLDDRS